VSGNSEPVKPFSLSALADIRTSSLLLTAICIAVGGLTAGVGYAHSGWTGILAAFLAAAVCWVGAVMSLVLAGIFRATSHAVHGVLLGIPLRMGLPLMACMVLARRGSPLIDAGILVMILLNYFVMLIADTWLLLRCPSGQSSTESVSRVS
jgi:hypothetical protein